MMINNENQRRKVEDSKKETGSKKETEGERQSLGYLKIDKGEGQKLEHHTGKERQKNRIWKA